MIAREQIKAARAMLDWSQKVLAEKCDSVSQPTIKLIETGKINSTPETLGALQKTLEEAGIEFLTQKGVRFCDDLITVIEKENKEDNIYLKLLDDIFYTLKGSHGEAIFSFIDNSVSSDNVLEKQKFIRQNGITMRYLVRYGDEYLIYPLDEYRYLPKGSFVNNPYVVYGNKFGVLVQEPNTRKPVKVIIINDVSIAEIKRKEFEIIWSMGQQPQKTIAEKIYD